MSVDLDIAVTSGKLRALPVASSFGDQLLINGPCKLCGFSLRDVSGETGTEASGSVTSPAALATIATTVALAAGTYDVSWIVGLAGTLAAADANNFRLVAGGTNILTSVNLAVAGEYVQANARVVVNFGATILVQAIALGTVGAVYTAQIEALPASIELSVAELQDGNNPLAEIACSNGGVDRAWYGNEGIEVYNRINFHQVGGIFTGAVYVRFDRYGD